MFPFYPNWPEPKSRDSQTESRVTKRHARVTVASERVRWVTAVAASTAFCVWGICDGLVKVGLWPFLGGMFAVGLLFILPVSLAFAPLGSWAGRIGARSSTVVEGGVKGSMPFVIPAKVFWMPPNKVILAFVLGYLLGGAARIMQLVDDGVEIDWIAKIRYRAIVYGVPCVAVSCWQLFKLYAIYSEMIAAN